MQSSILDWGEMLDSIDVQSSFLDEIKVTQFKDGKLNKLLNKVVYGEALYVLFDAYRDLWVRGKVCIPKVSDLIHKVLIESHGL